ncbi:hypothetical protein TNCV_516851 [Trichonephila clavipes]|nr:hypothetical protein TNCV_516851 [Trichonephila clavipes]
MALKGASPKVFSLKRREAKIVDGADTNLFPCPQKKSSVEKCHGFFHLKENYFSNESGQRISERNALAHPAVNRPLHWVFHEVV